MIRGSARRLDSWVIALPQRLRRVIVVISLAGLPGMYLWSAFWLNTTAPRLEWGPVSFVLAGSSLAGALVLYRFVRDRADSRSRLDERQSQLRDRALVLAYQVLSAAVVAAVAAVAIPVLWMGRVLVIDGAVAGGLAICAGVLIPLLPVATLAWIEPDPPAEA